MKDTWKNNAVFGGNGPDDFIPMPGFTQDNGNERTNGLNEGNRRSTGFIVVFKKEEDIEAWYYCPSCKVRSNWRDNWGDSDTCRTCGTTNTQPAVPMNCNFIVTCDCEHDGCTFSDCCLVVVEWGECRVCGSDKVTLREAKRERLDWYVPWAYKSEYD